MAMVASVVLENEIPGPDDVISAIVKFCCTFRRTRRDASDPASPSLCLVEFRPCEGAYADGVMNLKGQTRN